MDLRGFNKALPDTRGDIRRAFEEEEKRFKPRGPSNLSKVSNTVNKAWDSVYESGTAVFREAGNKATENFGGMFDIDKRNGPGAKEIISRQEKAKARNLPDEIKEKVKRVESGDKIRFLALVNKNASDKEINKFLDEAVARKTQADKKMFGAALEVASYGIGTPGLKQAFVSGGKAGVAKAVAGTATAGFTGGAGYELRENPDASATEILKSGGIGAGIGVGLAGTAGGLGVINRKMKGEELIPYQSPKGTPKEVISRVNKQPDRPPILKLDDTPFVPESAVYEPSSYAQYTAKQRKLLEKEAKKDGLSVAERFNNNFFDRLYTTRHRIRQAAKKAGTDPNRVLDRLEVATGNVSRSSIMGDVYMRQEGFERVMQQVGSKRRQAEFEEYLLAKGREFRRAEASESGRKLSKTFMTGQDQDRVTVEVLGDTYETLAQELHQYSRKFLREMASPQTLTSPGNKNLGLIDPEVAEELIRRNPDYIPLNKVLEEVENTGGFSRANIGSISESGVLREFKGAAGKEKSPLQSIFDKTGRAFNELAKNETATFIKNEVATMPGNPLGIRVIRSADDVRKRIEIRTFLKESRPIANQLRRQLKGDKRIVRQIQGELNALNKEGLQKSLKTTKEPNLAGKLVDPSIPVTKQELNSVMEDLINLPNGEVQAILRRIGTRDKRLAKYTTGLQNTMEAVADVNNARREAFYNIPKSELAKGKSTISRIDNGVKEILEVPDYMERALKGLSPTQANGFLRAIYMIHRVRKFGFTGGSPAFAGRNTPRDISFQGVVGESGLRGAYNPVTILKAYKDAIFGGATKDQAQRLGAFGNLVDTYRPTAAHIDQMRRSKNIPSKIGYTVTHPKDLFRLAEDAISITETAGRDRAFRSTYGQVFKKTGDKNEALLQATLAARRDSIDFFTMGEYGDILKAWGLYLNPAIQGTRRVGQALRQKPIKTTARFAASMLGPAMATTYWNISDDKRKEAYDDIPQWEKDSNYIIVGPNPTWDEEKGRWSGIYKIPKTPGIRELANAAEDLIRKADEEELNVADFIREIGIGAAKSVTPEESVEGAIVPDALEPAVQQIANKNFFTGKEIVPSEPEDRAYKESNSSPTGQKISEFIKKTTGKEISPLRIDAAIRDMGGSAGQGVQNLVESKLGAEKPGGKSFTGQITESFAGSYGGENKRKQRINDEQLIGTYPADTQKAYKDRHTYKYNSKGEIEFDDNKFYSAENAIQLLNDEKLFELEAKMAQRKNKRDGKPINPIFTVDRQWAKDILLAKVAGAVPGEASELKAYLVYEKPWYNAWKGMETMYEADKAEWNKKQGYPSEPESADDYPVPNKKVAKLLFKFNSLPENDGPRGGNKSRKLFIDANPELAEYFNRSREWKNKKRLAISSRYGVRLPLIPSFGDDAFGEDVLGNRMSPIDTRDVFGRSIL